MKLKEASPALRRPSRALKHCFWFPPKKGGDPFLTKSLRRPSEFWGQLPSLGPRSPSRCNWSKSPITFRGGEGKQGGRTSAAATRAAFCPLEEVMRTLWLHLAPPFVVSFPLLDKNGQNYWTGLTASSLRKMASSSPGIARTQSVELTNCIQIDHAWYGWAFKLAKRHMERKCLGMYALK